MKKTLAGCVAIAVLFAAGCGGVNSGGVANQGGYLGTFAATNSTDAGGESGALSLSIDGNGNVIGTLTITQPNNPTVYQVSGSIQTNGTFAGSVITGPTTYAAAGTLTLSNSNSTLSGPVTISGGFPGSPGGTALSTNWTLTFISKVGKAGK